jgi:hypothetical protein
MFIVFCGEKGRAVLVGECDREPETGKPIMMTNVSMILRWDVQCGGIFGLAAKGPKGDTRITEAVERHGDACVHQWIKVSDLAEKEIKKWKRC